jgi:hypothetical protein
MPRTHGSRRPWRIRHVNEWSAPACGEMALRRGTTATDGKSDGVNVLKVIDGVNVPNGGYGALGSHSIIFGSLGNATPFDFIKDVEVKTAGYGAADKSG